MDFPDTISIHKPSITCFSNLKEDFELMGIDEDVVVVVEGISNTMVFMVVIHQILKKRSLITLSKVEEYRGKIKRESVYKINLLRTENNCYRCGIKEIGFIPIIRRNIWSIFTKHQ